MISPEILKKIKELEIHTRRVMNGTLVGGHVTKQKGSGFEFDQIRAYSYGDDIRFMDWNSSARSGKLLVRQYLDEKSRTIMLCLDISASTSFASHEDRTSDIMQQVAAVLAYAAQADQDNIGLILFSDIIEKVIPPSRGYKHIMLLIETIFTYKAVHKKTNIDVLSRYLLESFTMQAAVFIISDFIVDDSIASLQHLICKREVLVLRCLDHMMYTMPDVGYVWSQNPETGYKTLLNFSLQKSLQMQKILQERIAMQNKFFKSNGIDYLDISCDESFVKKIILFFKRRAILR